MNPHMRRGLSGNCQTPPQSHRKIKTQTSTRKHTPSKGWASRPCPHHPPLLLSTVTACFCLPGRCTGLLLLVSPGTSPCPTIHLSPRGSRILTPQLFFLSVCFSFCFVEVKLSVLGVYGSFTKGFFTKDVMLLWEKNTTCHLTRIFWTSVKKQTSQDSHLSWGRQLYCSLLC